jgi:hypothetical protein
MIPRGPKCLRWRAVRPSGPTAVELLEMLIASRVNLSVNGAKAGSILCFFFNDLWDFAYEALL